MLRYQDLCGHVRESFGGGWLREYIYMHDSQEAVCLELGRRGRIRIWIDTRFCLAWLSASFGFDFGCRYAVRMFKAMIRVVDGDFTLFG